MSSVLSVGRWIASLAVMGGLTHAHGATIRVPEDQPTIQGALNAAATGDIVLVAPGVYSEVLTVGGKTLTLRSSGGAGATTLTHSGTRSLTLLGPSVVTLEGFTFTRTGAGVAGGISVQSGVLVAANCVFTGCRSGGPGGAVVVSGSTGMSTTFTNCTFTDNQSFAYGGAISSSFQTNLQVTNCSFLRNTASSTGGAIDGGSATLTVANCLFASNTATSGGALASAGPARISGSTFSANAITTGVGRAIYYSTGSAVMTLDSSIVWGNTGPTLLSVYVSGPPTVVAAQYSDIEGAVAGSTNINADPMFVNAAAGDYHLAPGSPCVDAGNTPAAASAFDVEGHLRLADDPAAPDTGVRVAGWPIVDMGAYERLGAGSCGADYNRSGHLEVADIFAFLTDWFAGCP